MRLATAAMLVFLSGACTPAPQPSGTSAAAASRRDVDIETFAKAKAAGEVPVLIDVRSPAEYAGGHVAGAQLIPLNTLSSRMDELAAHKDGPVYVICQSGGRSARAADQLAKAGFDAVNVQGGTGGWSRAGHPVEK